MGNLPPYEPPDLRNRRRGQQDDDDESGKQGNYPPGKFYPPAGNQDYPPPQQRGPINLDDPRFGGGEQYPPPQQSSPRPPGHQQRPQGPLDLDDPRFGGGPQYPPQPQPPSPRPGQQRPQGQANQYPPDESYPPPGHGSQRDRQQPRPQPQRPQGPIDLDDPRFGGGEQYPPPGAYPQSQGRDRHAGDAPRQREAISLDDPRYGPPQRRSSGGGPSQRRSVELDDFSAPNLRRDGDQDRDHGRPRSPSGQFGLSERQIEYLAWGGTILLLGVSLMMSVTGNSSFLTFFFPLLGGALLMGSALYQRVVRGWHVGPITWLVAVLLVSYTITLLVSDSGTGFLTWIAYFIGTLVIIMGLVLLMQAFRRS